ncbi:hypothetical protein OIU84_017200 [Salix udensis]|uniref:Uncharacterized protein n=1 Tax=Salix udensis TaxID=889485 RepID=A0AAD6L1I2_9ROSI|nr:hypothetical protein OIU84_017200 [Salix udensis]
MYAPVLFCRPSSSRFLRIPPPADPSGPCSMRKLLFCISLSISLEHTLLLDELLTLKMKWQQEVKLWSCERERTHCDIEDSIRDYMSVNYCDDYTSQPETFVCAVQ